MAFTPTSLQYAGPEQCKPPLWKRPSDPGADDVLTRYLREATGHVRHETGRSWCVPSAPVTLTYDAPYNTILFLRSTEELVDPSAVVVKVGGVALTAGTDFVFLTREIDGQFPHTYALGRLDNQTWDADARTAGRAAWRDITLENALPATTETPPDSIVEATVMITANLYDLYKTGFQRQTGGSEEFGTTPIPNVVVTYDVLTVLGPYIAPGRKIGRP